MQEQETKTPQPFFVHLLEKCTELDVQTDVKAGRPHVTMKYPSDGDEGGAAI